MFRFTLKRCRAVALSAPLYVSEWLTVYRAVWTMLRLLKFLMSISCFLRRLSAVCTGHRVLVAYCNQVFISLSLFHEIQMSRNISKCEILRIPVKRWSITGCCTVNSAALRYTCMYLLRIPVKILLTFVCCWTRKT